MTHSRTAEFFVVANSFAAPFCSDQSTHYVSAADAEMALLKLAKEYAHPAGLYAADCYASADAYHKGEKRLARWLCNHAITLQNANAGSYCSEGPGLLTIDGKTRIVLDPKGGRIIK